MKILNCSLIGKHIYKNTYFLFPISLAVVYLMFLAGCENKHKTLVSAHSAVGELLISTKGQTMTLYEKGIIDELEYHKIRVNWLRAQKAYLEASDMLKTILETKDADITAYAALITQVSTILSDVALWLEEDKK